MLCVDGQHLKDITKLSSKHNGKRQREEDTANFKDGTWRELCICFCKKVHLSYAAESRRPLESPFRHNKYLPRSFILRLILELSMKLQLNMEVYFVKSYKYI